MHHVHKTLSNGRYALGVAAGIATQLAFVTTVVYLFRFLRFGSHRLEAPWVMWDLGLALQFAVVHSALLHPKTRHAMRRWVAPSFYGLLFCAATCAGLLLTITHWRSSPHVVWKLDSSESWLVLAAFYGSWLGLFYSLYLSGLGYQTGLTPWWFWVRGKAMPRREFSERSLYRWFRHPIYLSFLGLIWFTPMMSVDRLLLAVTWSVYIVIGSYLKDERLAFYLGDVYRDYQARVPGYPFLTRGPLGKRRHRLAPAQSARNAPHPTATPLAPSLKERVASTKVRNAA